MFKSWRLKRAMIMLAAFVVGSTFAFPCAFAKGGGGGAGRGDESAPGPGFEPSGWDQGKKEGWKGADEPPGLVKEATVKGKDKDKDKDKGKAKGKDDKNKGKRK